MGVVNVTPDRIYAPFIEITKRGYARQSLCTARLQLMRNDRITNVGRKASSWKFGV